MKPMKVDAAPKQDIFRESISPIASEPSAAPTDKPIVNNCNNCGRDGLIGDDTCGDAICLSYERWIPIAETAQKRAVVPQVKDRDLPCNHCSRMQKEQDISFRLREMGDIELDILLSTQARLLMGQGQYGKFSATDPRDLPKEALEEVQDALVYVAKRLGELSNTARLIPLLKADLEAGR